MPFQAQFVGITSGNGAEVDVNHNLFVNLPTTQTQAGFATLLSERDSGSVVGSRNLNALFLNSQYRRLAVGTDTVLFHNAFNATAQNTAIWKETASTLTFAQAGGFLTFNNGGVTTTGTGQYIQSWRTFMLTNVAGLNIHIGYYSALAPAGNAVFDFGWFTDTTTATAYAPGDGVYFRVNSTGLYGVVNYSGTETVSSLLIAAASIPTSTQLDFRIIVTNEIAEFWWYNSNEQLILLGSIKCPAGNGTITAYQSQPLAARLAFTGTASSAWQPKITEFTVTALDVNLSRTAAQISSGMGLHGSQGTDGNTMGTTALYSNSLAVGSGAAMTNTAASLGTGLGGQFAVQPTLAAATDGIVCSYQVPTGGVGITPRTLVITGVSIQGIVTTTFTGGPVAYFYSLAYGHTAVSLATAEAAAAKAPRRIPLGMENYVVTAAIGATSTVLAPTVVFNSPIYVNPGEFVAVVAKNVGTVTSAGVIGLLVRFDCYWE